MTGALAEDARPWIPEDTELELKYLDYSTVVMFSAPKLVVRFTVMTMGEHFEAVLERWYRVRQLKGKPKKYGNFTVGASSDYYRDYCRLLGTPARKDRLSLTPLKHKVVMGSCRTVTVDSSQRALPEPTRYSVLEKLWLP